MTNQELVGRAMRARCNLTLPTKHRVAPGEVFRYLQAHLDGGASAELWLRARNVELVEGDTALPIPAEAVGPAGRRRARAMAEARPWTPPDVPPVPVPEPADVADGDTSTAGPAAEGEAI